MAAINAGTMLSRSFESSKNDLLKAFVEFGRRGTFILGQEVGAFEDRYSRLVGSEFGVAVGNATDALELALRAAGIGSGDLVATTSLTAAATVSAIINVGACPVLLEVDESYLLSLESLEAVTKSHQIKAVIAVHLYGQMINMPDLLSLSEKYGFFVIEDCSQAHLATFDGLMAGSFAPLGCFSFYPTKNLSGLGDSGLVVGKGAELKTFLIRARQYGWDDSRVAVQPGQNSRMDELQASFLNVRLDKLMRATSSRRIQARQYCKLLDNVAQIQLPRIRSFEEHAFHQFVIRVVKGSRDQLQQNLLDHGVNWGVHYKIPCHLHPYFKSKCMVPSGLEFTEKISDQFLSLPVHEELLDEELKRVVNILLGVL